MIAGVRFRALDAAMIRLAAQDGTQELPPWPDLTGETSADVPDWRGWLHQVWAHEATVEAIEVASPHLAQRVEAVRAGQESRPRRVRRVVESVVRYLLRMRSRATPFGHFAGVAPVRLGRSARVRPQQSELTVARPDATWLAAVIADFERRPEVLRRLTVVANNLGYARTDRWVLAWQQQPGRLDQAELGEVSIRHTRAVQIALQVARCPVTVADLADTLATELVEAPRARIDQMLMTLVAQRVLITSLHPPMETTNPLDHVIAQLAATATYADGLQNEVRQLRAVRAQLAHYGGATWPGQRRSTRIAATRDMAAIRAQPKPRLAIDLHADAEVELPRSVTREAEIAASALARLNPHPFGTPAWRAYHARFLERYGSGAVVPLTEILHPVTGLGFPSGYRGSAAPPPQSVVSDRDRCLLRLAQQAAVDQQREVVLDEHQLAELAPDIEETQPEPPPHTELRFHLNAPTPQALDRAEFTLVVNSAARQAAALTGRFLHLFEQPDRERITEELAGLPSFRPGAQLVQLSCPPLVRQAQHLARAPAIFPRLSLAEHPTSSVETISVEDVAVSGDDRHLFLISLSRGCVVEPVMLNAVEFRHATHPLARFLCEIPTARAASCKPFMWGVADDLAFLPRLRYRRTILAPARWSLAAADLPNRAAPWREWEQAWSHLWHRRGIPERVYLGEQDRRLGLDLAEPTHLALLRRHLQNTGHAELTEAPAPKEQGWLDGRTHEIVIALANSRPQESLRSKPLRVRHHAGHTPGASPWLYARLHAPADQQTDILTRHLPALLEHWHEGPCGQEWFLRYREPEPHLRLRLPLHDADHYGAAAQRLGTWAHNLQQQGLLHRLVLDTYYPEVGRFGTGTTLRSAEATFAADSAAVLAQLTLTSTGAVSPHALTAVSFINLAAAFTGGLDSGMDWLVDHPHAHPRQAPPREVRDEVLRLADPDHGATAVQGLFGGEALLQAWQQRHVALQSYHARLAESDGPDVEQVLASLLHLHHTRMIGIDRESERTCFQLARAAALSVTARRQRSTSSPL